MCTADGSQWTTDRLHRTILRCDRCALAWVDPAERVGAAREEARYREHNNTRDDPRYVRYLSDFIDRGVAPWLDRPMRRDGSEAAGARVDPPRILDFGSGPNPVLSELLRERGYDVTAYDPFFAPDSSAVEDVTTPYDAIVMLEVIEHLFDPLHELARLVDLLVTGGYLSIRTSLRPETTTGFQQWWYTTDPTHVVFLAEATVGWICDRFNLQHIERAPGTIIVLRRR